MENPLGSNLTMESSRLPRQNLEQTMMLIDQEASIWFIFNSMDTYRFQFILRDSSVYLTFFIFFFFYFCSFSSYMPVTPNPELFIESTNVQKNFFLKSSDSIFKYCAPLCNVWSRELFPASNKMALLLVLVIIKFLSRQNLNLSCWAAHKFAIFPFS